VLVHSGFYQRRHVLQHQLCVHHRLCNLQ
jgi:hypothetical protein